MKRYGCFLKKKKNGGIKKVTIKSKQKCLEEAINEQLIDFVNQEFNYYSRWEKKKSYKDAQIVATL